MNSSAASENDVVPVFVMTSPVNGFWKVDENTNV